MGDKNKIDNPPQLIERVGQNVLSNVEGIFSLKPMAKYLSGARCVLRMNGKIVGFAFGISWKITTDVTEINTIDDYLPYELAPSRISVNGTIAGFRIPGTGPGVLMLQPDILSFLHQRYVDIEVRDSQTDNLIFQTKRAMITSRTENISAENLAQMTMEFRAIGFVDERSPQIPAGVGDIVDTNGTGPVENLVNKVSYVLGDLF